MGPQISPIAKIRKNVSFIAKKRFLKYRKTSKNGEIGISAGFLVIPAKSLLL